MILNLISNCPHNLSRYNFLKKKKEEIFFCKSSTKINEMKLLKNEINGIKFFNKYSEEKIIIIENFQNNYGKIEIKKIDGKIINPNKGFENNIFYIEIVFKKYLDLLKKSNINFSHGDLSFSNIIFTHEKCYLIDWEHFSLNNLPKTFDLLYFMFENVFFDHKFKKKINQNSLNYIVNKVLYLKEKKLLCKSFYKGDILSKLVLTLQKEKSIWNYDNLNLANKFPILQLNKFLINKIDTYINERIQNT